MIYKDNYMTLDLAIGSFNQVILKPARANIISGFIFPTTRSEDYLTNV